MRPKLGTVFPEILDSELESLEIDHIVVSKERRSVNITFPFEVAENLMDRISTLGKEEISEYMNMEEK